MVSRMPSTSDTPACQSNRLRALLASIKYARSFAARSGAISVTFAKSTPSSLQTVCTTSRMEWNCTGEKGIPRRAARDDS